MPFPRLVRNRCVQHTEEKPMEGPRIKMAILAIFFHLVGETGLTDMKQPEDNVKLHIIK